MSDEQVQRCMALWKLMQPRIMAFAAAHGATPTEVAVAMTIGTPQVVFAASAAGDEWEQMERARALFGAVGEALVKGAR